MILISHRAYDAAVLVSHGRAWIGFYGQALGSRCLPRHVLSEGVLVCIGRKEVGRGDTRMACPVLG
jgi:hypothetical protein